MSIFPDGTLHTLPRPVGAPGVLAAIVSAVPAHFAPTDELVFTTPVGDAFARVLEGCATRQGGRLGRIWIVPVGEPAVADVVRALEGAGRAGAVYTYVYRDETPLLECEESYDWLWLSATLPAALHESLLDDVRRRLGAPREAGE